MRTITIGLTMSMALMAGTATAKEWRFNNFLPENRPESAQLERFTAQVNEATGNNPELKLYNGGSLGVPNTDVLRFLPRGAVEMSLIWANYLGRDAPALSSVVVQGTIGSIDEFQKAIPTVRAIYEEEFADWGVSSVGYVALPMLFVSVFCRDEPVNSLDELRDRKLRVWARDQVETFSRLGVAAQIIPQEEMYVALRTGVVDCALYPALYASTVSLQEVAKHAAYLYPMASGPYVIGVGTDTWEAADPAFKQAVSEAADALWQRTNQYDNDVSREHQARQALADQGVVWAADFSDDDRKQFVDTVTGVWAEMAEEAGGKAPQYRQRVLEALGR